MSMLYIEIVKQGDAFIGSAAAVLKRMDCLFFRPEKRKKKLTTGRVDIKKSEKTGAL